ncbi:MAG: glycoside hydrolase family 99-like domain-containing protein [Bacteroidota bacterium]
MALRPIAVVLPQFHPIAENDEWWGKGFTEWTNVTKAKPLFEGHYQPHLPADLGFYDLRLPEAREAQAAIAKEHGIYGFCYYHYWFNGKRLLNQPIDDMLRMGKPEMPFMLCWANENWTRRWDGAEHDVLINQDYSFDDDEIHMRWLCENVFSDDRYITVNGCPVFAVYRHKLFPNIKKTAELWRKIAKEEYGYKDIYLCVIESFHEVLDPKSINFDAAIEFSPHQVLKSKVLPTKIEKVLRKLKIKRKVRYSLRDYDKGIKSCLEREDPGYKLFRSVTPAFDNTPRKKDGLIAMGSNPIKYFYWLKSIINNFRPYSKEENFVFINAMNEWAEGNHLEPCIKYGKQYLEATKKAIQGEQFE